MGPIVRVVSAGITTIQDGGRKGLEHLGVPISGAWDLASYQRITDLLGVSEPAVFECLMGDFEVELSTNVAWVWAGPGTCLVESSTVPHNSVNVHSGRVRISRTGAGPIYLAAAGLDVPLMLGSVSTDTHSGIGPARVQDGDVFTLTAALPEALSHVGNFARLKDTPRRFTRFVGHDEELAQWIGAHRWSVTASSRTGVRCTRNSPDQEGRLPAPIISRDSVSYPTLPGIIQVPSADEIIILGPDCGTTGGYSTAGAVITADLGRPAYLGLGDSISFAQVDIEAAAAARSNSNSTIYRNIGESAANSASAVGC